MVVQDTRTWDRPGSDPMDREIRYVERVRSALGIDQALCAPPRSAKRNGTVIGWVPALRFPTGCAAGPELWLAASGALAKPARRG